MRDTIGNVVIMTEMIEDQLVTSVSNGPLDGSKIISPSDVDIEAQHNRIVEEVKRRMALELNHNPQE